MTAEKRLGIDWSAVRDRIAAAQRSVDSAFLEEPEAHAGLLRERTRRLAIRHRAAAADELETIQALVFVLGSTRYALATDFISAIGPWQSVRAIPGASRPLIGLFLARGLLWALYDLPLLLGSEEQTGTAGGYLLHLRDWPRRSALRVDKIVGLKNLNLRQLTSVMADTPADGQFVHGVSGDGLVVLDAAGIRNHPAFLEGL